MFHRFLLGILLACNFSIGFSSLAVQFAPAVTNTANYAIQKTAAADYNEDGHLDLFLLIHYSGATGYIGVYLGNGEGSFNLETNHPIKGNAFDFRIFDLNEDGRLDAIVSYSTNYCISFGLPDGTFTTQSCYSVSGTLTGVLLADYDSDGILDLINPGSTMSVRPGLGGGLFGAITNHYLGGGHNPRSVFWDFDGDGLTDLVRLFDTSSSTSLLNIYKGSGPGAFTNHQDLPFDFRPERISRADFTGNGHQDILLVGANRPLLLAKNNGSGDFSFAPTNAIARTTSVSQPAIADFNGDGLSDVALTYYYSAKSADVFVNTGAGFSPPITNAVGDLAGSIIAGDFDRDGRVDLVVASYSPAKFHYLRNVTHPSLRIDRHKPFLEVSWPAWKGFDLYISTNLTTGSWNLQNSYIFETGNRNRFSFNPIQQQVFFKLVERSE